MPQTVIIPASFDRERRVLQCATEDELLAFCNKIRKAGEVDVLKALLPAVPGNSSHCLIAKGLNFSCTIRPNSSQTRLPGGGLRWYMRFPFGLGEAQMQKIANVIGAALSFNGLSYEVLLPEDIGNAAEAFDVGVAFRTYRESDASYS